ncbi:MAG: Lytic transglycosylase catalytic [Gemmatimonadetes bacterium]|nr:Lytic transglycosylase catalytic [Gemmatimonadota bacterium]
MAIAAGLVVLFAATETRPVFISQTPIAQRLLKRAPVDSTFARAPWLRSPAVWALSTPQFLKDREAFAHDLLKTGRMDQQRASELADVAVREAYKRKVPPALVLGVMLVENDAFKTNAKSRVGAVGLMQVHPRPWRPALSQIFGSDVKTDSVNLKYGIYILGHLAKKAADEADAERGWRGALLRYNGCSEGTNTPDCHHYPEWVKRRVERQAKSLCGGRSFGECVATPLWIAKRPDNGSGD